MTPELFKGNVIIQGITGTHGAFHAARMKQQGTNIVAGTSPNTSKPTVVNIPVYQSISAVQQDFQVDISLIFVPAKFAKSAVFEAIDAQISLIIIITEGIPVHDMLQINQHRAGGQSIIIGPNCPGVLATFSQNLGIIPATLSTPGATAIVSRSGTLTYEAMDLLTGRGIGQRYVIGIGGDRIKGVSFTDCLALFESDPEVNNIVLIGEIGGQDELEAANYIKTHITKPVFAYIAGHHAPVGVQLGHAGAVLGINTNENAHAKTEALKSAGATTATNLIDLIKMIQ